MPTSTIWPVPPSVMNFKLYLFIQGIKHLPVNNKEENCTTSKFAVQVEWGGGGRTGLLSKRFERNCTSKRLMQETGVISWNEGFDHTCKIKKIKSNSYGSWIICFEIQELDQNSREKLPIVGKAKVDVAKFSPWEIEKQISVPIKCNISGHAVETALEIKLQFFEIQTRGSTASSLPRVLSLRSFSCMNGPKSCSNNHRYPKSVLPGNEDSSSSTESEPSLHYGKLATSNLLLITQSQGKMDNNQHLEHIHFQKPFDQSKQQQQASPKRLLLKDRSKRSSRGVNETGGPPLLNKAFHENGRDDIDNDRHKQSIIPLLEPLNDKILQPQESSQSSEFKDENRFEVGRWEKKRTASRDGKMELVTDTFFASIDQRSEKASGGSACTVLSAVIAHWLHHNPETLPLRCQFDELIREGSLEWRKLCEHENHKGKFSDQHFDLETVIESKVRPLSVVTEMSYVGFFGIDGMANKFEFLQGAMSFDTIWDELVSIDTTRVYIVSWNDHFFIIKAESDVIYLIDTLGERLFEGCNEAYILKFNKESTIYARAESGCQTEYSNKCETIEQKAFCEGRDCCKGYIKEFLASLPLRELHHDIERGSAKEATLHRRLQIEFHYTVPCDVRS